MSTGYLKSYFSLVYQFPLQLIDGSLATIKKQHSIDKLMTKCKCIAKRIETAVNHQSTTKVTLVVLACRIKTIENVIFMFMFIKAVSDPVLVMINNTYYDRLLIVT